MKVDRFLVAFENNEKEIVYAISMQFVRRKIYSARYDNIKLSVDLTFLFCVTNVIYK